MLAVAQYIYKSDNLKSTKQTNSSHALTTLLGLNILYNKYKQIKNNPTFKGFVNMLCKIPTSAALILNSGNWTPTN